MENELAQHEPEPVAWHEPGAYSNVTVFESWANENGWLPLYTAPPQREWVGLTREELAEIAEFHFHGALSGREFYDDVEAKLKEKNNG